MEVVSLINQIISIGNAFQKIISEGREPNKIWVDQGSEFYYNSFNNFLKKNNIEMYSVYNEGKSIVAERFIRTLRNKIFKHMTVISKNVYFEKNVYFMILMLNTMKILIKKILNLVTMLEFQNIKIFLLKNMLQIRQKKFLLLVKLKIEFLGLLLFMT